MSRRSAAIGVVFSLAAFLLMVPRVPAGDRVHSGNRPLARTLPASTAVVGSSVSALRLQVPLAVVVTTPSQPAKEPLYVDIRGPDGQIRRFPVEGGSAAIQYRKVLLHPGERLTIRWTPAK